MDSKTFIKRYTEALQEGIAAIFAGAGLSQPAGFVNWRGLLREIAEELGLDIDKEHDLISIAQYHINEHGGGRGTINQILINEFTEAARLTQNHQILASLPISTYWTTNYDTLIEDALKQEGKIPDVKITQKNLATTKPKRDAVVYKMHGDISQADNAVLSKDDYEKYELERKLFVTSLQGDLVSKTFLFIGFSFSDPNLDYILSRVRVLLGNSQRPHYAFFRKTNRADYDLEEDYVYEKLKQDLMTKDLKRFAINCVFVEEYADIATLLEAVQKRYKKGTVFISGAAVEYDPFGEEESIQFVHDLSHAIVSNRFKVVSGFGLGIGSAVINGALDYIYSSDFKHLDEYMHLRPFPQISSGDRPREELWREYREDMISRSGIAIFLFGNKQNAAGDIVPSNGMMQEFEIALEKGVKVLPVGATGYVARNLWDQVIANPETYYGTNARVIALVRELGTPCLDLSRAKDLVLDTIGRLRDEI